MRAFALAACLFAFGAISVTALAQTASRAPARAGATPHVKVTVTDAKFTLSRRSAPTGTVLFTVTNKGKRSHDFAIAGKKTPLLSPSRSATLRVTFASEGHYPYRSTVSGQSAAGLRGVFSVVAAAGGAPSPTPSPVPPAPPPYTPPTGPVGNANTTVTVTLYDYPNDLIALSQTTIPSGNVTFVITNKCQLGKCSFDLVGVHAGAGLDTNQSETWTVALAPGVYQYHCDFAPSQMKGSFTVTP